MNKIIDLKLGDLVYVACSKGKFIGEISSLDESAASVINSELSISGVPLLRIFPLKITTRFLRLNGFSNPEEGDSLRRHQHTSLPIIYSTQSKELTVFGKLYPIRVYYVHHLQHILVDLGIKITMIPDISDTAPEMGLSISHLIGGLRDSDSIPGFIEMDTNMMFGLRDLAPNPLRPKGGPKAFSLNPDMGRSKLEAAARDVLVYFNSEMNTRGDDTQKYISASVDDRNIATIFLKTESEQHYARFSGIPRNLAGRIMSTAMELAYRVYSETTPETAERALIGDFVWDLANAQFADVPTERRSPRNLAQALRMTVNRPGVVQDWDDRVNGVVVPSERYAEGVEASYGSVLGAVHHAENFSRLSNDDLTN